MSRRLEQDQRFEKWSEAADVLGIAIGLHLHASPFDQGNRRR
jgi:hypothetical protein